jgi:hypothetical protein
MAMTSAGQVGRNAVRGWLGRRELVIDGGRNAMMGHDPFQPFYHVCFRRRID